jgi:hypothetical protein
VKVKGQMNQTTKKWRQLEKDLSKWLGACGGPGLEFRNSFQAIVGFRFDGFRSDGMLTDGRNLLAIEVEVRQAHPDTNTGKYWFLWNKHKQYEKIVLFHIYTPGFDSYGYRKALAKFYVDKMKPEVPMEYFILDYIKASQYESTLTEIKATITVKARELFGSKWICT